MSDRKNILFLPEWYPNHTDPQLGVFVQKYARAVSAYHNIAVIYVYPSEVPDSKVEINKNDFLEIKITYPKKRLTPLAARAYINHHKKAKEMLYAEWGKPHLVHLHMLFRNFIAWDDLYRWDCPNFVLTEQWSGYLNGNYEKLPLLKKKYFKSAFKQAKACSAVSNKLSSRLQELFGVNNIDVIANIAERSEVKAQKNSAKLTLLVVADLVDEIKNISGIIEAYTKADIRQNSELIIIGDGKDKTQLESLAQSQNLVNKQISFKGRLHNAAVLENMQLADFLVINSRFETFSMVAAEALLAGIPVVCSRCGGPEEFLNSGNSILVDINNTNQLTEAIGQMATKHKTFNADELAAPVLQKFGMAAIGKKMSELYAKALK